MGFSEKLKSENIETWDAILEHPFIHELGVGTLPLEKFTYYIQQDYLYLIEFARCIGLAVVKAEGLESMRRWAEVMDGCLKYEMGMLEEISVKLKLPLNTLSGAARSPTNRAYTNQLLNVAYTGTLGENIASLLPCMWTYQDVGVKLASLGGNTGHPVYEDWCQAYNAAEYSEIVAVYKDLVDFYSEDAGDSMKEKMRRHFAVSMQYEYLFWDMAYSMEKWPFNP